MPRTEPTYNETTEPTEKETIMSVKINREEAVALFVALGLSTASKWNTKRMASKLSKIDELVDDDITLEGDADELLTVVLEAVEAEEKIEVVTGVAPKATKDTKAASKAPEKSAEAPEDPLADLKAKFDAGEINAKQYAVDRRRILRERKKAGKTAPKAKEVAKSTKAPPVEKPVAEVKAKRARPVEPGKAPKDGPSGVRICRGRPYLAGKIIKKHGHGPGITKEMVEELDREYGSAKPAESLFTLRNAWQAIRGFIE